MLTIFFMKYGIRDYRGGGRQSARETAARVAAGAVAKKVLETKIGKRYRVVGAVTQIGILGINPKNWDEKFMKKIHFFVLTKNFKTMGKIPFSNQKAGSSCGAVIEVRAKECQLV